jgi:hypothetical protein
LDARAARARRRLADQRAVEIQAREKAESESVGIPTWYYGNEPPNLFASHTGKYFFNSVREDGLVSIASGGIVFGPGNAGTVQEIFQDAPLNYYREVHARPAPWFYWVPTTGIRGRSSREEYSRLPTRASRSGRC